MRTAQPSRFALDEHAELAPAAPTLPAVRAVMLPTG
jgi:hypothetical protein